MSSNEFAARVLPESTNSSGNSRMSSVTLDQSSSYNSASNISQFRDGVIELTRNAKYCVSKLPALPAVLRNSKQIINGSINQNTNYALAVTESSVNSWNYASSDQIPETYVFASNTPVLGLLVSPIAGNNEPGLITIGIASGLITYWESVGGATANDLLHKKKNITYTVKLYSSERIEQVQNIEPAGVVATTSSGRYILITFRDTTGKPSLNAQTMRGFLPGLLASIKGAVSLAGARRNIVSIRPGKSTGRDERQALFITQEGNILIWDCFRNGQSRLILEENLRDIMINTIITLYPKCEETFMVHDVAYDESQDLVHVLTSFVHDKITDEIFYTIFTFGLQNNMLEFKSTHRIITYTSGSSIRPQLLLPKPYSTYFVLFSHAVVLVDALPNESDKEKQLIRRWEDIITFLPGVSAFAFGKEDINEMNGRIVKYAGVIVFTEQSGILRIERFNEDRASIENLQDFEFMLAKTKIEQAVFYSHRDEGVNPLNFDSRKEFQFSPEVLESAFLQISKEIINSTSSYLPPMLPSLSEHLELRLKSLEYLLTYLSSNFSEKLSKVVRLQLLSDLEKLNAAKLLWADYDYHITNYPDVEPTLGLVVTGEAKHLAFEGDPIRSLFINNVDNLVELLISTAHYGKNSNNVESVNQILIIALYEGAFAARNLAMNELLNLTSEDLKLITSWTDNTNLLLAYESQYNTSITKVSNMTGSEEGYSQLSLQLVHLVAILCELYVNLINRCFELGNESAKKEGEDLQSSYEGKRDEWLRLLVKIGHKSEARDIAEQYHMYRSLAEILVNDLKVEKLSNKAPTVVYFGLIEKIREQLNKFGYEFASVLYSYYVETKQLKSLLTEFPEFNEYLEKFFESGKYKRFSWLYQISLGEYDGAATTLTEAAKSEHSSDNKGLLLSIAKLSALASSMESSNANPTLQQIEAENFLNEIQLSLRAQILPFVSNKKADISKVSTFLQNNRLSNLTGILERAVNRFVSDKRLSVDELIDILTLIDINPTQKETLLNFYKALRLLVLPTAKQSQKQIYLNRQLIWSRLYLRDE